MFLGAKIIDSTLDGTLPMKYSHYNQWIERFERDLWSRTRNLAYEDPTHPIDTLEVRFHFYFILLTRDNYLHPNRSLPFSKRGLPIV